MLNGTIISLSACPIANGLSRTIAGALALTLVGCGTGGKVPVELSEDARDLQANYLEDVSASNIADLLSDRCETINYDIDGPGEAVEQFTVEVLVLAAREGYGAAYAKKILRDTSKLRKTSEVQTKVAKRTEEYWISHFEADPTEEKFCASAHDENNKGTDIGRFLKAS
jgi:hypothetical protein